MIKRIFIFLLIIVILLPVTLTCADSFSPLWERFQETIVHGKSIKLTLTGTIHEWQPFLQEKLNMLNQMIKHMKVEMLYQTNDLSERTDFALFIGDQCVAEVSSLVQDNGKHTVYTPLGGGVNLSTDTADDPLLLLLGESQATSSLESLLVQENAFTLSSSLSNAQKAMETLTSEGKTAKKNKKFGEIGNSATTITYTLSKEEGETVWKRGVREIETPFLKAALEPMAFVGDRVKVVHYIDKSDIQMGYEWKFNAMLDNEERQCTLMWTFSEKDLGRLDIIEWMTTNMEGKDKKIFTARVHSAMEGQVKQLSIELNDTKTVEKIKESEAYSITLQTLTTAENEQLHGEITHTRKVGEEAQTLSISPTFALVEEDEGIWLNGNIQISQLTNDIGQIKTELSLVCEEAEMPLMPVAKQEKNVSQLSDSQRELLFDSVVGGFMNNAVSAVFKLPKEDLALLAQYILPEDLHAIIEINEE